jgi:hypothetical protein
MLSEWSTIHLLRSESATLRLHLVLQRSLHNHLANSPDFGTIRTMNPVLLTTLALWIIAAAYWGWKDIWPSRRTFFVVKSGLEFKPTPPLKYLGIALISLPVLMVGLVFKAMLYVMIVSFGLGGLHKGESEKEGDAMEKRN